MRLESEWLSLATNIGSFITIMYLIKSGKEVLIHWMYLRGQAKMEDSDLLGPIELRYHGGALKPNHPLPLTTLHVESAEDRTIQQQEDSTSLSGLVKKFLGVDHVSGTR